MNIRDLLEEVYLGVSANTVRSGLTMLGIVIGIGSVIAMVSIGQGAKAQIEQNIQSIGSNLLLVMPGAQRGLGAGASAGRGSAQTLTLDDAEALSPLQGVLGVSPETSRRLQISAKGTNTNTQVVGAVSAYPQVRSVALADGAFFSEKQVSSRAKVAVLGPTVRDDLFGEGGTAIGQKIRLNGMEFSVIGVTAAKGGSGFSNQDDMLFIPLTTFATFVSGNASVSTIAVQAETAGDMAVVQQRITEVLLTRHKIGDAASADFSVLNQSDLVSAASSVTETFTTLLASIASISLLVGGIGIMNMMLTTVTERTREIGLRQAIGATKEEILAQFLGEAVLLTVFGGLVGIGLGYAASKLIQSLTQTATVVSWSSVALAGGVSVAIGILFGLYPAQRAARLHPIQALRFE